MFKFTLLLVAIAGIFAMSVEASDFNHGFGLQEKREAEEYAQDDFRQEKREEMEGFYYL